MSLIVYKSSAGSGKTSTLVVEYLALALAKPRQFNQIIALTFTIKATGEMKERLIEYLVYLQEMDINNIDNKYIHIVNKLQELTSYTILEIKNRSEILLQKILHNYGDFGFSTIDSFVVKIVRSFSHDLQLASDFEIELDRDLLIEKALEKFYNLIGKNKDITKFLVDFVLNQLDDEKSTDIDKPLSELARITFESKHYTNIEKLENIDLENFIKIKTILNNELRLYNNTISDFGEKGFSILKKHNLQQKDCSKGWLYIYFNKLKQNHDHIYDINSLENKTFLKFIDGNVNWYAKNQKADIINKIEAAMPELIKLITEARLFYKTNLPDYILYKLILKNITPLALIHVLKKLITEYSEENEVVHLSEANKKIAEIIQDQHTPYIYERIGHQYSHYLIDEFQDTSVIQWNNILPLIDNSLANGKRCLLVGDAKQSIYRWRDGEVEQFVKLPKLKGAETSKVIAQRQNLIKQSIKFKNLDTNYRSLKNIIDFNNVLFKHLLEFESDYVKTVFTDYKQKTNKKDNEGFVKLKNFDEDKDNKDLLNEILTQVLDLINNQNYRANEICIIARKNKLLITIADFLTENNLKVMSSDALRLYKSKTINYIISILNIVEGIDIPINTYIASSYLFNNKQISDIKTFDKSVDFFTYINDNGINLLYSEIKQYTTIELVEKILSLSIQKSNINPFVYRLLDIIIEENNNIGSSTSAFLKFWEEKRRSLSINIPDADDAIRLHTIHSVKGLEFPVVIFPTLSLKNTLDGRDKLWVNSPDKIKKLSPLMLVSNESQGLRSTEYKLYENDLRSKELDNINLLYVACTRPTEQLFLYFNKEYGSPNLWNTKFKSIPPINTEIETRNKEEITIGIPPIHKENTDNNFGLTSKLQKYIYSDWRSKIQIKSEYRKTAIEIKKQKGIQLHFLLSKISKGTNIPTIVKNAIRNNEISVEFENEFIEILETLISNEKTNRFFNESDYSLKEKEIITPDNKIIRPDKVIYKKNEIWVIDYKFANQGILSEYEYQKHRKQVSNYVSIINQIEGKQTKGFLLYLQGMAQVFDINQ